MASSEVQATTAPPASHAGQVESVHQAPGDARAAQPSSANDPLVQKLIKEWMDVSRNGSIEPFRKDLAALKNRDFADGQPMFRYRDDLEALNKALTEKNLLPNMRIVGSIDGEAIVREGTRVNQFGVLASDGHLNEIKDADVDWANQKVKPIADAAPTNLGEVSPLGVNQGDNVGDCRFEALLSSYSNANPDGVKKMIKDNGNGTYTVTFPGDKDHPQTVSTPTAWERDTFSPGAPEWDAILGKAYRQRENTPFGPGTESAKHIEGLLTGKPGTTLVNEEGCNIALRGADAVARLFGASSVCSQVNDGVPLTDLVNKANGGTVGIEPSALGDRIKEALDHHMMITTAFFSANPAVKNSTARDAGGADVSVIADHAYSVLGYDAATQTITLRNPWGRNYRSSDGVSVGNGVVTMSLAQFQKISYGLRVEATT